MKRYMVFMNGRRVYTCNAKSKRGALNEAKSFLKSLGDCVDGMKWDVLEQDRCIGIR